MIAALRLPRLSHAEWARLLPFALFMLCLVVRSELGAHIDESLVQWLYVAQMAAAAGAMLYFSRRYPELSWREGVRVQDLVLSVVLGVCVFFAWVNPDVPVLSYGSSTPGTPPPMLDGHADWRWIVLRIAGAALIVPLMEELFWRSLVMRWLQTSDFMLLPHREVGLRAVLLSSFVFGLEHTLWFAGIVAGLVYAWLFRRAGLWAAVIAHATTNLLLGLWVVHTEQWQFW